MRKFPWVLSILIISLNASAFVTVSEFENSTSPIKILVFLSKECPCSRSHAEHLNELSTENKDHSFFGVITDKIESSNKESIEEYFNSSFKFPIIKDEDQKLVKAFAALKTPHVTILKRQPNGKYTAIYDGGVSDQKEFSKSKTRFLRDDLLALAAGQPLPHANGRSLGCYIRRL